MQAPRGGRRVDTRAIDDDDDALAEAAAQIALDLAGQSAIRAASREGLRSRGSSSRRTNSRPNSSSQAAAPGNAGFGGAGSSSMLGLLQSNGAHGRQAPNMNHNRRNRQAGNVANGRDDRSSDSKEDDDDNDNIGLGKNSNSKNSTGKDGNGTRGEFTHPRGKTGARAQMPLRTNVRRDPSDKQLSWAHDLAGARGTGVIDSDDDGGGSGDGDSDDESDSNSGVRPPRHGYGDRGGSGSRRGHGDSSSDES
jgi:hypothetical protein